MSAGSQRVALAPGFLLHQRPWRDTSLIVEIFARGHGRLTVFARGARGSRPRFHALRPFQPLLLSWSGRGEAPTLTAAEPDGPPLPMPPEQVLSAFYLSELVMRLTTTHDPHAALFDAYAGTLAALRAGAEAEFVLRRFEIGLLEDIGFGLELGSDESGRSLRPDAYYDFRAGRGLCEVGVRDAPEGAPGAIRGDVLVRLAAGELPDDAGARRVVRAITRAAIDHCLEGRELKTRAVARSIARGRP